MPQPLSHPSLYLLLRALLCLLQVPVKKHHILPLKIAGAVAKAFLSNMESEGKHQQTDVNVVEEVEYVPTPVPVAASAPPPVVAAVPTFAVNETVNSTMGWSG